MSDAASAQDRPTFIPQRKSQVSRLAMAAVLPAGGTAGRHDGRRRRHAGRHGRRETVFRGRLFPAQHRRRRPADDAATADAAAVGIVRVTAAGRDSLSTRRRIVVIVVVILRRNLGFNVDRFNLDGRRSFYDRAIIVGAVFVRFRFPAGDSVERSDGGGVGGMSEYFDDAAADAANPRWRLRGPRHRRRRGGIDDTGECRRRRVLVGCRSRETFASRPVEFDDVQIEGQRLSAFSLFFQRALGLFNFVINVSSLVKRELAGCSVNNNQ